MQKIVKQQVRTHIERVNRILEQLSEEQTQITKISADYASCYGGWAIYHYTRDGRYHSWLSTRISTREAYAFLLGIEFTLDNIRK